MKKTEYINEIRGMTLEDLQQKIVEMKEELFKLRFRKAGGQLETTHRVKEVRKDISRVKTILKEKGAENAA